MARNNDSQTGEGISVSLGTLGANTALKGDSTILAEQDGRVGTARLQGNIGGVTAGEMDRVLYGICQAYLSNAEIAEILVQGPRRERDVSKRAGYARLIGHVKSPMNGEPLESATSALFDSGWIKLNMEFMEEDPLFAVFYFNMSTAALTTGATTRVFAQSLPRWKGA